MRSAVPPYACCTHWALVTPEGGHGGYIPRYGLMHYLACFTLFDDDPLLVNSILDGFNNVTLEQVRAAAQKYLDPARRALVIRRPSKKGAA